MYRTPFSIPDWAHPLDPASLAKFVDPLPRIPVLPTTGILHGSPYYEVAAKQFQQQLHADLAPTTLWGYDGRFPGPTFEELTGRRIYVKWTNDLPDKHLLAHAFDPSLSETGRWPQNKTVVHVHGARVPWTSDGHPMAWFTRHFEQTGSKWVHEVYEYSNRQDAATMWYHDHAFGQTRLNLYAGLAGVFLLRSPEELDAAHCGRLPSGERELALVIQDRSFNADGSLFYPVRDPSQVPTGDIHPGPWVPESFGEAILVNGKVWPYLDVEPTRYRLRLLNASNARFYRLTLDSGEPFLQIGTDLGWLPRPVLRRSIVLAPAERVDVIVDFSRMCGKVILRNDAPTPFPMGDPPDPGTAGQVMQFRVGPRLAPAMPEAAVIPLLPAAGDKSARELAAQATLVRNMGLVEFEDENDEPFAVLLNNRHFESCPQPRARLGTVEVWNLINATDDTHPIHLHLVHFYLLWRRPFDAQRYRNDWIGDNPAGAGPDPIPPDPYFTGPLEAPEANERGPKDTVQAAPGYVTTIVIPFIGYPGLYPWHCHILEHEDNDMMLQYEVSAPDGERD